LHESPEARGKGVREIASYFLSAIVPQRIGLLRLGTEGLNQAAAAIAAGLEQSGKRVLLLRSEHQQEGADLIAVRTGGFREGPLAEWKTCNGRLAREERASDILLFLLHPEIPSLSRLLSALNLLVLVLPGERAEALGAYRSAKRLLINRRDLSLGLFVAGEGEAAAAVLDRFMLGLQVFLGLCPLNLGTTASTCAQEIAKLKLDSPVEPYFLGNS
jgi:hypothetical protein